MSPNPLRLLVLDAYAPEGRAALRGAGGSEAGALYARVLRKIDPDVEADVIFAADADARPPAGVALGDYDGACWTGSSLTIHVDGDERVRRQVDLARALLDAGVPGFGSCFAAQIAAVAGGGRCAANPKGREFGIARRIELSEAGRAHPLFTDKPARFDAFTSHADEVSELPTTAETLASNAWSRVQALDLGQPRAPFWAVQYHPEYDCREVAALTRLRAKELVEQGTFDSLDEAGRFAESLDALHADPTRGDLAESLGIGADLLDFDTRTREVRNWLARQVRPRATAR